jgi:hypothetical protein
MDDALAEQIAELRRLGFSDEAALLERVEEEEPT